MSKLNPHKRPEANSKKEILEKLYENRHQRNSLGDRVIIHCQFRHVGELEELNAIKKLDTLDGGHSFALQFKSLGYEIMEEYGGWDAYKKNVLDKQKKILNFEYKIKKYWWIPLLTSVIALGFSIASFF